VAGDLERHFQGSPFPGDDDLVFAHPHTGNVLDHSDLGRRFKKALRKARVREVRFNDLRHSFGTRMAGAGVSTPTTRSPSTRARWRRSRSVGLLVGPI
jgi:integrase